MEENKLTARLVGGIGGTFVKVTQIVLKQDNWYGGKGKWEQIVEVEGASIHSKIDLQPSVEMLLLLQELEVTLTTVNDDGVITVYAIGNKPETDITIQATYTEIIREKLGEKVHGNTVGWVMPLIYPKKV